MNRLTNKHSDGKYYPSINNIVQQKGYDGSNYREFIHTKLGKLEDLMEKYGIENVKELDKLLQTLKDYIVKCGTYNCENDTYGVDQLSIIVDEDDGEDFKIIQKILW